MWVGVGKKHGCARTTYAGAEVFADLLDQSAGKVLSAEHGRPLLHYPLPPLPPSIVPFSHYPIRPACIRPHSPAFPLSQIPLSFSPSFRSPWLQEE